MTIPLILGVGHQCAEHAGAEKPLPFFDDDRIVVLNGA
jgi:hypothetical protein